MNEEEKKAIEKFKFCGGNFVLDKESSKVVLNLIEKLQKENEELKKEIERQKDINTVINEKGLDKNYEKALEKTMTKFLKNNIANDFISKQTVKDKIEKEIKYHEKNILDIENVNMLKSKTAKEEAEIEFNKYAIVVLKKILQELIEEMIKTIQNNQERNMIKDINNFKRELKRDGLYSNKLDDFIEDYMKYYNN